MILPQRSFPFDTSLNDEAGKIFEHDHVQRRSLRGFLCAKLDGRVEEKLPYPAEKKPKHFIRCSSQVGKFRSELPFDIFFRSIFGSIKRQCPRSGKQALWYAVNKKMFVAEILFPVRVFVMREQGNYISWALTE